MNMTFREQSIAIERKTCTHVQLTIITGKERYIRTENVCEKKLILSCGPEETDTEGKKVNVAAAWKRTRSRQNMEQYKRKKVWSLRQTSTSDTRKNPGSNWNAKRSWPRRENFVKIGHSLSPVLRAFLSLSSLSHLVPATALCFRFVTRYRTWASSAVPVRPCGPLATTHIPKSPPLGMPYSNTSQASSVIRNLSSCNDNGYLIQSLPFNSCRNKIAFISSRINNYGLLRCHGGIGADGVSHWPADPVPLPAILLSSSAHHRWGAPHNSWNWSSWLWRGYPASLLDALITAVFALSATPSSPAHTVHLERCK